MTVRIAQRVAWQSVGGETVVINLEDRRFVGLTKSGGELWALLASDPGADLAAALVSSYGIPRAQAEHDAGEFVGALHARGLVELEP